MAIIPYKKHGKELFRVYVQALGKKDRSIRVQKNKFGIKTIKEAIKEEKKLIKLVNDEVNRKEGKGISWFDLMERWEVAARYGKLGDTYYKNPALLKSHIQRLYKYTKPWFRLIASELSKGDGRIVLNNAKELGATPSLLKKIKSSINVVFKWGMEEKLILGVQSSPTEGLVVKDKEEKLPMILSLEEIKLFLQKAKELQHPWYPIWAFAFFTGMRSGELLALQWNDLNFEKDNIVVSKSYKVGEKKIKSTKAGYWRNIPISDELRDVIDYLKKGNKCDPNEYILPRHSSWLHGDSSKVIRGFLTEIGIDKYVVLHTLRACFATHMLALGCDQATVMKIGGWCDLKTFQIYVRLSGVETRGATNILNFNIM